MSAKDSFELFSHTLTYWEMWKMIKEKGKTKKDTKENEQANRQTDSHLAWEEELNVKQIFIIIIILATLYLSTTLPAIHSYFCP